MNARTHKMLIHTNIEISDHENIGTHLGDSMCSYADIDRNRFSGNGGTNYEISGRKPHPRPGSNTLLQSGG